MAATQFRPSGEGWIFRAPTPLGVGPHPHYIVDDAKKATIEIIVGAGTIVLYVLVILLVIWFLLYPAGRIWVTSPSQFEDHVLTFMIVGLSLSILQNLYHCFALWPLLRTSPRSAERITLVERMTPLALYSKRLLSFGFLFLAAAFLIMTYRALTSRPWDIAGYIAVVATGAMAAYYGLALWARRQLGRS
ncbi:MAG: hypothetical protein WDO17_08900 [Alphaproteobacteria bacterium]